MSKVAHEKNEPRPPESGKCPVAQPTQRQRSHEDEANSMYMAALRAAGMVVQASQMDELTDQLKSKATLGELHYFASARWGADSDPAEATMLALAEDLDLLRLAIEADSASDGSIRNAFLRLMNRARIAAELHRRMVAAMFDHVGKGRDAKTATRPGATVSDAAVPS